LAATLYPGSSSRTRTAAVSWVCTRCSHMAAHATPQRTAPTTPRLLIVREHDTHRTPCMTRTSLLPVVVAGSHWEQRLLETEVMAPLIVTYRLRISRLTLALLEDSGWYTPDYSLANVDLPGEWVLLTHCAYSESLTYSRTHSPNHPTTQPSIHPPIHPSTHPLIHQRGPHPPPSVKQVEHGATSRAVPSPLRSVWTRTSRAPARRRTSVPRPALSVAHPTGEFAGQRVLGHVFTARFCHVSSRVMTLWLSRRRCAVTTGEVSAPALLSCPPTC
jgi:hypothetical protein